MPHTSHTIHPAFAPLHVHFMGEGEALLGTTPIPTHSLLNLYPVEMASYRSFFIDYYTSRSVELRNFSEINKALSGSIFSVENAIVNTYSMDDSAIALDTGEAARDEADRLAAHLMLILPEDFWMQNALSYQMSLILRAMALLAKWDEAAFAALREDERRDFFEGLCNLADFFEVPERYLSLLREDALARA
jgi:hypothetical protein